MSAGSRSMSGANFMRSSTSRRTSMPGATSVSARPLLGQAEHGALGDVDDLLAALERLAARIGDLLDLRDELDDLAVTRDRADRPEPISSCVPLASNVPQNTTFLAFCAMSMKPPGPTVTPPSFETFTLPIASISPKPRNAMSSPPPE